MFKKDVFELKLIVKPFSHLVFPHDLLNQLESELTIH